MIATIDDVLYNQHCKKEHVELLETIILKMKSNVDTTIQDGLKISRNNSGAKSEARTAARNLTWGE